MDNYRRGILLAASIGVLLCLLFPPYTELPSGDFRGTIDYGALLLRFAILGAATAVAWFARRP